MSRYSIWNDANCLAARSSRPTFFNYDSGVAVDVLRVHYAQDVYRDRLPLWYSDYEDPQIKLDEKTLPAAGVFSAAPAILPNDQPLTYYGMTGYVYDERFTSGLGGFSSHEVFGRTIAIHDIYTETTTFSTTTNARTRILISEGRQKPFHRMRGALSCGNFFDYFLNINEPVNLSQFVDSFGTAYALKTTHVPLAAMFVPKVSGQVSMSGVYAAMRLVVGRTQYNLGMQGPVDYTASVLPPAISMIEIGTFAGTTFTSQSRLFVANFDAEIDCGLARNKLSDESGTTFCCVIHCSDYAQAIEFPYVPPSLDAVLCGTVSPDAPTELVQREAYGRYMLRALVATARKGFNSGECPAFQKETLDHGRLVRVPFFAGAPATKNAPQSEAYVGQPFSPQWATWVHSQFPYTMQKTGALTVDGSIVPVESLSGQRHLNTPIYDLSDYVVGRQDIVEHHPSRVIDAKAARVQATAMGSHFEDASMTIGKPRGDGKMVFGGKTINSLTLQFVPYSIPSATALATGIQPVTLPSPVPKFDADQFFSWADYYGLEENKFFTYFSYSWWKYRKTVQLPYAPYYTIIAQSLWNGEVCEITPSATYGFVRDGYSTTTFSESAQVSESKQKDVYAYSFIQEAFGPYYYSPFASWNTSSIDDWLVQSRGGGGIRTVKEGPLTGEYTLERFSLGGVNTAGNMFRYFGAGDWSVKRTETINLYPVVTSVDDYYSVTGPSSYPAVSYVKSRSARFATVPITAAVELKTDIVELYCSLGAGLQQAGSYQSDPQILGKTFETFEQTKDSQRNWLHQTFMKHDEPRGRLADTVVYVDGLEPSPVLKMTLRYRTAMRAKLTASIDTSDLPAFPLSVNESSSDDYGKLVTGLWGTGNVSGDGQTTEAHHQHRTLDFTFSKEQTQQLMNGAEVLITNWQGQTGEVLIENGFFNQAIKVRLDVSEA